MRSSGNNGVVFVYNNVEIMYKNDDDLHPPSLAAGDV